jgi:hypothetical protein
MRVIFGIFPLLAIPVIIYNMMALTANGADVNGVSAMAISLADPTLGMSVFGSWRVTSGDILIILSMCFFFVEILKSTSTGSSTIANHAVSMLVFIVCLIEFLLLKNFQTSAFFILTIMCPARRAGRRRGDDHLGAARLHGRRRGSALIRLARASDVHARLASRRG